MAEIPVSPAAFPQNRPSVRSAAKRGRHYGRNARFPRRVSAKSPFCAFCRETWPTLWPKFPFPPPRFRKIGLLCVLPRNVAGVAGWGVHEGIGGKGDARGPRARSGAALQHDGVRSRTVRHAEGGAKRDALAVKRLGQPPFPPLTEWIPHPAAGHVTPIVLRQHRPWRRLAETPQTGARNRPYKRWGGAGLQGFSRPAPRTPQTCAGNRPYKRWGGAGLQGFSRPAPRTPQACAGNRPYKRWGGAGLQGFSRLAPRTPQTCARNQPYKR